MKIYVIVIETEKDVLPADLQSKIEQAVREAVAQPGLSPLARQRLARKRMHSARQKQGAA